MSLEQLGQLIKIGAIKPNDVINIYRSKSKRR